MKLEHREGTAGSMKANTNAQSGVLKQQGACRPSAHKLQIVRSLYQFTRKLSREDFSWKSFNLFLKAYLCSHEDVTLAKKKLLTPSENDARLFIFKMHPVKMQTDTKSDIRVRIMKSLLGEA